MTENKKNKLEDEEDLELLESEMGDNLDADEEKGDCGD